MAAQYAFPMEGMMGPSTPIDRISARNSMFAGRSQQMHPGEQVIFQETLRQNVGNLLGNVGQKTSQAVQQAGALFPRGALLGGVLAAAPTVMSAVGSAQEGRTLEAATTAGVGIPTALGATALGTMIGGPVGGVIGGIAGGLLAPVIGQGAGALAEKAKAEMTGEEIAGQPGSASASRGMRAKERAEMMKDAALQAQIAQQYGPAYLQPTLQAIQDLRQNDVDMMVQSEKRLDPIIRQRLNDQMVRQQTLMNTQGQNYAMLGALSTAGQLATGGQRETGATLRTALTANPYAGSTLQAPQISF
jgi:citrate lyase gamma subunit